ncbi:MAG: hypothetical protein AAGA33_08925 [Pseudomonadota bacterium]
MTAKQFLIIALVLTTTIALSACATPVATTTLADGTTAYRIDCDSSARGINYCFEKAGKSCGADGYTIVSSSGVRLSTSRVAEGDLETLTRAYESDSNSIYIRCGT